MAFMLHNGETTVLAEEVYYTWRINNFSLLPEDVFVSSPCLVKKEKIELYVQVKTNKRQRQVRARFGYDFLDYYQTAIYVSGIPADYRVSTKIVLQDKNGKVICNVSELFQTFSVAPRLVSDDEKLRDLAHKNKLVNDILDMVCEIKIANLRGSLQSQNNFSMALSSTDDQLTLNEVKDFSKYLNSEKFSDLKLFVSDKPIFAHKLILSQCSTVFETMLTSNFKEKNEGVVKIDGISYGLFFEALRFMYSGKVKKLEVIAKNLLVVADRYDIKGLKEKCIAAMYKEMTMNNAKELYDIASMYNIKDLRRKAFELMSGNLEGMKIFKDMKNLSEEEEKMLVNLFQNKMKSQLCDS